MMKLLTFTMIAASLAAAQTPSGLLTGPVTYTSTLKAGNLYGDNYVWLVKNPDGSASPCSASGIVPAGGATVGGPDWIPGAPPVTFIPGGTVIPNCFMLPAANFEYKNLAASDGTSDGSTDCYSWNYEQLIFDDNAVCETTFHGNGSGEDRVAIYCPNSGSTDVNGTFTFNATGCGFDGTSVVDSQTQFTVATTIKHHPVMVWIPQRYRSAAHWATWQQIDSMAVTVTPPPSS